MKRLFDDNHEWSEIASGLDKYIKACLQKWVAANPGLDPRDVQLVASESIADAIRWMIVRERIKQHQEDHPFDPDADGDDE
jgi:hypothetical protein